MLVESKSGPGSLIVNKLKDTVGLTAFQKHKDPDYQKGKPDNRWAWLVFQFATPFTYREHESGVFVRTYKRVYESGQENLYVKTAAAMETALTAVALLMIATNPENVGSVGSSVGLKLATI